MPRVLIFSNDEALITQIHSLEEYEVVIPTEEMKENPSKIGYPDFDSHRDIIVIDLNFTSKVFAAIDAYYHRSTVIVGTSEQQVQIAECISRGLLIISSNLLNHIF